MFVFPFAVKGLLFVSVVGRKSITVRVCVLKVGGLSFFGFAGGCGAGAYFIFAPLMRYDIWLGVLCRSISIKPEVDFVHSVLSPLVPLSFF